MKDGISKHKGMVKTGTNMTTHVHLKDLNANRPFPSFKRDKKFKMLPKKKKVTRYLLPFKSWQFMSF